MSGHMAHPSQSHTAHYRLTATADADDATCNVRPLKGQVPGTIPNINRRAGARLLAASSGQAGQLVHGMQQQIERFELPLGARALLRGPPERPRA